MGLGTSWDQFEQKRSEYYAAALLHFAHDEGALDGADALDVAKLGEDELLIVLHIARTYL